MPSIADVVLPSIFQDNMVLQRETEAAIWGKATPGKKVVISPGWAKINGSVVFYD